MFALAGPVAVQTDHDVPRVRYFATDEALQFPDPLAVPTHYTVWSRGELDFKNQPVLHGGPQAPASLLQNAHAIPSATSPNGSWPA